MNSNNVYFGKEETFVMKGVAVLLMLIHHLFYGLEDLEKCDFWLLRGGASLVVFAQMCKVCVAIFVFLSGFGLFLGASKVSNRTTNGFLDTIKYSFKHILKLETTYWWAVIPFAIIGITTGMRSIETVYGVGTASSLAAITDLFGINFMFYGYDKMYNITCWYLGVAIALYVLFPLLKWVIDRSTVLFAGISLLIVMLPAYKFFFLREPIWIASFALGMICAKYHVLDRIMAESVHHNYYMFVGAFVLFLASAILRYQYPIMTDSLFAFSVIVVIIVLLRIMPRFQKNALIVIGKHSANIFMTHTFFFSYFWKDFIYSPRYPVLIFLLLLTVTLAYSAFLNHIKGFVRSFVSIRSR